MKMLRIPFLLLCLLVSAGAFASDAPAPADNGVPPAAMGDGPGGDGPQPPHHGHHRPGPPPEALAACKGQTAGAKASLKTPRGDTIKGSCQLVFVPDSQGGDKVPPPPPHDGGSDGGGPGW